jgi:chaperonin GroES
LSRGTIGHLGKALGHLRKVAGMGIKFRPVYDQILVQRLKTEDRIGSIIIPDSNKEKPNMGVVIVTGSGGIQNDGRVRSMCVRAGQTILFQKWGGIDFELDTGTKKKTEFVLIKEEDVLGILG